jgi:hypothetical protein
MIYGPTVSKFRDATALSQTPKIIKSSPLCTLERRDFIGFPFPRSSRKLREADPLGFARWCRHEAEAVNNPFLIAYPTCVRCGGAVRSKIAKYCTRCGVRFVSPRWDDRARRLTAVALAAVLFVVDWTYTPYSLTNQLFGKVGGFILSPVLYWIALLTAIGFGVWGLAGILQREAPPHQH